MYHLGDEEASLLRAIVSHSMEDIPRLVYSDWLEEYGDSDGSAKMRFAHAKLIRNQISLTHDYAVLSEQGRRKLLTECNQLRLMLTSDRHSSFCFGGLRLSCNDFERGFPLAVSCEYDMRIQSRILDAIALYPVEKLTMYLNNRVGDDALLWLASRPELQRISSLKLMGLETGVTLHGLRTLLHSPHVNGVEHLQLTRCGLDDDGVRVLVDAPRFERLRSLGLEMNRISPVGVTTLAEANNIPGLEEIDLRRNDSVVRYTARQTLCGSPHLPCLRHVILLDSNIEVKICRVDSSNRGRS